MTKLLASKEEIQVFLENCQQRTYAKNEDIVKPGDPADTLYYVLEGSLVVTLEEESGQELILAGGGRFSVSTPTGRRRWPGGPTRRGGATGPGSYRRGTAPSGRVPSIRIKI